MDLSQLTGMDRDALQKILKEAKAKLGEIQKSEKSKKEIEFEAELAPYREQLNKYNEGLAKVAEAYDQKIEEIKEKKKVAVAEAKAKVDEFVERYNEFRKTKGLPPVNVATRKRTGGAKEHSYGLIWPEDAKDVSWVKLTVDDGEPSEAMDLTKGIALTPIKTFLEKSGIEDKTGGKARGLVNRIKKQKADRVEGKKERKKREKKVNTEGGDDQKAANEAADGPATEGASS